MREGQNINSSLSVLGQAAVKDLRGPSPDPECWVLPFLPRTWHLLFCFSLLHVFGLQPFVDGNFIAMLVLQCGAKPGVD